MQLKGALERGSAVGEKASTGGRDGTFLLRDPTMSTKHWTREPSQNKEILTKFDLGTADCEMLGHMPTHRRRNYEGCFPNSLWPISYLGVIWELCICFRPENQSFL